MINFSTPGARTRLDVAATTDIAQRVAKGDANALTTTAMQSLLGGSALVLDGMRVRPRYFDGRFLTGTDLTRDQDYVAQRQADLARATGTGVVAGLQVTLQDAFGGRIVHIAAGHGITPAGDLVLVSTARDVTLDDLPASERLDAALGLRVRPAMPLARRTGLFILALRPVEFTANPIAAFPTTIAGPRSAQDGDIIEATAITLIPYPDKAGAASLDEARRTVARSLFVDVSIRGLPLDALPLAMLALDRGVIRWLDMDMVRREIGADTPLQISMGARPRALAEAHVLQYDAHLADVLASRAFANVSGAFAAAQYFAALPSAGRMPADAISVDSFGFRQLFFPPAMQVDISFVPQDEIGALVEESLALPPIDLLAPAADLDNIGAVVLVPVTRQRLADLTTRLDSLERSATNTSAQTAARQLPVDLLITILQRRALVTAPPPSTAETAAAAASDAALAAWQAAWRDAVAAIPPGTTGQPPLIWFVRRRTVAMLSTLTGAAVVITGDDAALATSLNTRLIATGLADRVQTLRSRATPFADARLATFLGSARILRSDLLLNSAVRAVEITATAAVPTAPTTPTPPATSTPAPLPPTPAIQPPVTETMVLSAAARFADPRLGDGLDRLLAAYGTPAMTVAQVQWLANTGAVPDLDVAARDTPDAGLATLATKLRVAVGASDADSLNKLIAGG
jgi:hypothetical protein